MVSYHEVIPVETSPGPQAIDITRDVLNVVAKSNVSQGLACIFTPSSTSAIVANEFEPGLMTEDIPAAVERLFPQGLKYGHERRWHDETDTAMSARRFSGPAS